MRINKDQKLKDVQSLFTSIFPGLKIEFYRHAQEGYDGPYTLLHYDNGTVLGDVNENIRDQQISTDESMKVSDFEKNISEVLGINVQVFRRSKELWLQTTKTDDWTLKTQNLKGIHSLETQTI